MKTYTYCAGLLLLGAFCAGLSLLRVFPACFSDMNKSQATTTLFIQSISTSPTIAAITEQVTPAIDALIKKELGIDQDAEINFFYPKELQRISLYYVYDIIESKLPLLFDTLKTLKLAENKPNNSSIELKSKVEFFGKNNDELVVIIHDDDKELARLNLMIKTAVNKANNTYRSIHNHELYNIDQSERFPFLPHMGLGRISIRKITKHVKDQAKAQEILSRIRESIKKITHDIVKRELAKESVTFSSDRITVLDTNKRVYIKEWQ